MKRNCWEFKKCGREANGSKAHELGVCPASSTSQLHGIHGGLNSGRACWVVTGTYCRGEVQGTFAKKYNSCSECDFYRTVKVEESPRFMLSTTLLKIMNGL